MSSARSPTTFYRTNTDTVRSDGDEASIRRSVVALTESHATPNDHGTIGSEPDAVFISACDGDEVGIRWSVVAQTETRATPSDHGAAGDTTSCQAAKRGGVVLVECSYTTERVHCTRRECMGRRGFVSKK